MSSNVRPIRLDKQLRTDEAERLVRQRARDSENVLISRHAYDRLQDRTSITDIDVYYMLREGYVRDAPIKNKRGDWEVKVQKALNGNRDAAVVTIIFKKNDKLKVKTVMWIDP